MNQRASPDTTAPVELRGIGLQPVSLSGSQGMIALYYQPRGSDTVRWCGVMNTGFKFTPKVLCGWED
jgi:hypothetical protein